MASMRQRKADAANQLTSPSSRGSLSAAEQRQAAAQMTQIVIEDVDEFDSGLFYSPAPPRFIPDKQYKDFMLGRAVKKKNASMCPDGRTCAGRCIGFSWVAAAFLFWVYFLIDNQPIFIKGIQPKGEDAIEGVTFKVSTADQHLTSAANAWYAAIAYLFTILLCTAYRRNLFTVLSIRMRRRQRNSYEDIPDTSLSSGGGSDANLPMFHQEAYNTHRGPCHTVWQRIMMQIKNCTQRLRRPARNKRRRE